MALEQESGRLLQLEVEGADAEAGQQVVDPPSRLRSTYIKVFCGAMLAAGWMVLMWQPQRVRVWASMEDVEDLAQEEAPKPCLCIFDIDRTLTTRQDAAERCPVASEAQKQASGKVIMDYAYGGGPLLLSEVAQHLDQTFCSRDKCHMGIISAGGGSGPDEQGVLFSKLDAASPGKAGDATFSHWGEGPMSAQKIIFCPDPDKGKAAKKLYDWLNNEKQAGIAKDEVYFFDDHTGNAAEMAEFGFNGREIACEPRDQMIGDGIVGLCGALLREIQREKGIKTCKQLIEDGFY